ncbi:response regulator [Rhodoferax sp.]|uniref:response regulator n=1 Tax=Rhodoferax sp. TaxID=50421 RepID=UPI00262CCC20|nr:response regulator [Rhodoferax sp.]MDD2808609.1 response regulator [Rhodoferax sp.]MDD4942096.1 response regulator [Rhodoferax sp.]
MPSTLIEKSFCTTREAAKLLGVSIGTVQLWVENGLLQAWKTTGGHRRVMRDSVAKLLHQTSPSSSATLAEAANPSDTQRSSASKLRILVVEDDADLLRLYQIKLSAWPIDTDVTTMDNAVSAMMRLGRGGIDLLITDLNMPGMDGFAMLQALHRAPELVNTTVVAVSGLNAAQIADHGGLPPGVALLPKPIPFDSLQAIATRLAKQSQL